MLWANLQLEGEIILLQWTAPDVDWLIRIMKEPGPVPPVWRPHLRLLQKQFILRDKLLYNSWPGSQGQWVNSVGHVSVGSCMVAPHPGLSIKHILTLSAVKPWKTSILQVPLGAGCSAWLRIGHAINLHKVSFAFSAHCWGLYSPLSHPRHSVVPQSWPWCYILTVWTLRLVSMLHCMGLMGNVSSIMAPDLKLEIIKLS